VTVTAARRGSETGERPRNLRALAPEPAIEALEVTRHFRDLTALDAVSVAVRPGEIQALLGPNGAGKTTLLRALTGLVTPDSGSVRVMGEDASRAARSTRAKTGFVPSGDRTFYLRLSGLENLLFFARLQGIRRRAARDRALRVLDRVGLSDAGRKSVASYSHGMQKRLSLARALLTSPPVLLVDEATHDLDPEASAGVRQLVAELAGAGATVLWATQRIDEIRGFATGVTLLRAGRVAFSGSVPSLMAHAQARHFVVRLDLHHHDDGRAANAVTGALATSCEISRLDEQHWRLELSEGTVLGDAIAALAGAGVAVIGCHRERSELEEAFMALSVGEPR
jgi:ABC-2 type transport system ATP-binding protein